jgi:hypothetical protein
MNCFRLALPGFVMGINGLIEQLANWNTLRSRALALHYRAVHDRVKEF